MNNNALSPYIRVAKFHSFSPKFHLARRIIYDYELIYACGGGARLVIGDDVHICKKNDVILLRPGVTHDLIHLDDLNFVQPHIHFDLVYNKNSEITPICFKDRCDMNEEELSLIEEDILEKSIPYVFTPCDQERFGELFFDIMSLYQKRPPRSELTSKIKMLELLSLIFEQFEVRETLSDKTVNDPAAIVKSYIDNNYLQQITLEGLQRQFYINKYTLIRNFNKLYKKSPIAYYHERRIEFAKEQLTATNRSVSSIAAQMNQDSYSFNRFFRKSTGISPSEYRRLYEQ